MMKFPSEYLGDGVYAAFDGYHILLRVHDPYHPKIIAIDPAVLAALNAYHKRILDTVKKESEPKS